MWFKPDLYFVFLICVFDWCLLLCGQTKFSPAFAASSFLTSWTCWVAALHLCASGWDFDKPLHFLKSRTHYLLSRKHFKHLWMSMSVQPSKDSWLFPAVVLSRLVFIPLLMTCNIPSSKLTILFHRDWAFVVIMALFSFSNGYLASLCMAYAPQWVMKATQILCRRRRLGGASALSKLRVLAQRFSIHHEVVVVPLSWAIIESCVFFGYLLKEMVVWHEQMTGTQSHV